MPHEAVLFTYDFNLRSFEFQFRMVFLELRQSFETEHDLLVVFRIKTDFLFFNAALDYEMDDRPDLLPFSAFSIAEFSRVLLEPHFQADLSQDSKNRSNRRISTHVFIHFISLPPFQRLRLQRLSFSPCPLRKL